MDRGAAGNMERSGTSFLQQVKGDLSWRNILRIAGLIVLATSLAMIAISAFFHLDQKHLHVQQLDAESRLHVMTEKQILLRELQKNLQVIMLLRALPDLPGAFVGAADRERTQQEILSFMRASRSLDQIRLINREGREVVRVNSNEGHPELVPATALQDKSARYYVDEMRQISGDEVYVSALDLNVEHGRIQQPPKPSIRFAAGIRDGAGKLQGYLLINVRAADFLAEFRQSGKMAYSEMELANSEGYLLVAPEASQEWGFARPGGKGYSLARQHPQLWQHMLLSNRGEWVDGDDHYAFDTLQPDEVVATFPEIHISRVSARHTWKIIAHFGAANLAAAMGDYRRWIGGWVLFGLIVVLLFALPLAILIERRRDDDERIRLLSEIVEQADEPIFITSNRGLIEYVNPAFSRLTGYTADDAVGKNPSQLLKSNVQDQSFYQDLWSTISQGKTWSGHLIDRKKDGSLFPADITITPITGAKGRTDHFVALLRDDTKGQLLFEKQIQENKMKSLAVAVGGIAHEFNNILAGMMGNAYLVSTIEKDQPDVTRMLNDIEELGNRAAGMIRQMLTYVGEERMRLEPQDLAGLMRQLCKEGNGLVPERIQMDCSFPIADMHVNVDATQLQNVLRHLVANAVDAMADEASPRLAIGLDQVAVGSPDTPEGTHHPARQYARISVRDNGCGIAAEHRDLLFEPFFTTKDVGKGTGLGLSTIHGIVQKHDGYIEVESTVGEGSEFRILLPLLKHAS